MSWRTLVPFTEMNNKAKNKALVVGGRCVQFTVRENLRFRRVKQIDRISRFLCFKNRGRKDGTCYQDLIEKMIIDKIVHGGRVEKKTQPGTEVSRNTNH